jgi:hypothetical protein
LRSAPPSRTHDLEAACALIARSGRRRLAADLQRRERVDERASDTALRIEGRIEDRDLDPNRARARHRRAQDSAQLVPAQAVGKAVVDGGHDRVVEHVGVEVDPEAVGTVLALEVRESVAGGTLDSVPAHRRQVERPEVRWERLAALGSGGVGVPVREHDHILVAHERPAAFQVRDDFGATAGNERQVHRCRLAARFGLGLVEVGVPVEEEQAIPSAPPQRE